MRRNAHSIQRGQCFFCCHVVIRIAVLAIRAGTVPTSPSHQWLGGQHGEEAKDQGEDSGQERRQEEGAQEEEVGYRCFTVFDFNRRR
jgi:hypothetical protein